MLQNLEYNDLQKIADGLGYTVTPENIVQVYKDDPVLHITNRIRAEILIVQLLEHKFIKKTPRSGVYAKTKPTEGTHHGPPLLDIDGTVAVAPSILKEWTQDVIRNRDSQLKLLIDKLCLYPVLFTDVWSKENDPVIHKHVLDEFAKDLELVGDQLLMVFKFFEQMREIIIADRTGDLEQFLGNVVNVEKGMKRYEEICKKLGHEAL